MVLWWLLHASFSMLRVFFPSVFKYLTRSNLWTGYHFYSPMKLLNLVCKFAPAYFHYIVYVYMDLWIHVHIGHWPTILHYICQNKMQIKSCPYHDVMFALFHWMLYTAVTFQDNHYSTGLCNFTISIWLNIIIKSLKAI